MREIVTTDAPLPQEAKRTRSRKRNNRPGARVVLVNTGYTYESMIRGMDAAEQVLLIQLWMHTAEMGYERHIPTKSLPIVAFDIPARKRRMQHLCDLGVVERTDTGWFLKDLGWFKYTARRQPLSPETRRKVIERDGYVCGICSLDVDPDDVEIDHIFPVSRGGNDHESNLRVTHSMCNRRKGAKVDI